MKTAGKSALFVDTGAWLAVNHPRDGLHAAATVFYREKALTKFKTLVTSNLVVAEAHASLVRAQGAQTAYRFLELLEASSRVTIIYETQELGIEGRRILAKYEDQRFSLCDAISFAIMKDRSIRDAFAFDSHFETAGFHRLP